MICHPSSVIEVFITAQVGTQLVSVRQVANNQSAVSRYVVARSGLYFLSLRAQNHCSHQGYQ